MPLHPVLQELDRLDESSDRFPRQLADFLSGEGYIDCITELQNEDGAWLIEYLDNVGVCVAFCLLSAER